MITVNSWDEMLRLGRQNIFEQIDFLNADFSENLILTIKVTGESWDGYIDYRAANYVLELQSSIDRIYRELAGSDIGLRDLKKNITVKVRVSEGSSNLDIDLTKVLKSMLSRLSGRQITLIVSLAILGTVGYLTTGKILDHKRQAMISQHEERITKEVADKISGAYDKALEIISKTDAERANRSLIHKLETYDSIKFPGNEELTSVEAKNLYPRKPKTSTESGIFDGTYQVLSIDFEKNPPVFHLYKGGLRIPAIAELSTDDIDELANNFRAAMSSNRDFMIPIHLFISYNKRGIKKAAIQSIGTPRENSEDIDLLISMW